MYTISPFDFKDTALDMTLNSARISHSSQKLLFSWVSVLTGREDTTMKFVHFFEYTKSLFCFLMNASKALCF